MSFRERISQAFFSGSGESQDLSASAGHSLEASRGEGSPASAPGCLDQPSPDGPEGGAQSLPELEAALEREKRAVRRKDEELALLQQLLANLESSIEQQAQDAQLEQSRISMLERTWAEQKAKQEALEASESHAFAGADEKVEKLLLALSSERQMAVERQSYVQKLEQQLKEEENKHMITGEALSHMRQRVSEEEARRHEAERQLAEKQEELRKLQQHGSSLYGADEGSASPSQAHLEKALEKAELKERLASQSEEILGLKAQLVQKTQELAKDEAKGESKSTRASSYASFDDGDLERQKSVHTMLIQKEREVCDLQQQLAGELSKRREVQQQNIERERLVLEKDRQMVELQTEIATLRCQRMQRSGGSLFDGPQVGLRALRNFDPEDRFSDTASSHSMGNIDPRSSAASLHLSVAPSGTVLGQPGQASCPRSPGMPLVHKTTPSVQRRREVGMHDQSAGGLVFHYNQSGSYNGVQGGAAAGIGMAPQVVHRGFAWPAPGNNGNNGRQVVIGERSGNGSQTYR